MVLSPSCTQKAVQEAAAVHCGHSEELPRFLLEEEVPAAALGSAHLPETGARPAGPPGLQPATGGEEEGGGGGGAPQEEGGADGKVSGCVESEQQQQVGGGNNDQNTDRGYHH